MTQKTKRQILTVILAYGMLITASCQTVPAPIEVVPEQTETNENSKKPKEKSKHKVVTFLFSNRSLCRAEGKEKLARRSARRRSHSEY
jgi:hypothetical protein